MKREGESCATEIVEAFKGDIPLLERIAAGMGGRKEEGYFEKCFAEKRRIFTAGEAGYVQLNWHPAYAGFRRFDIPEVQDLCVLPDFRNRGIGGRLVAHCEQVVRTAGKAAVGISVGLYAAYGPAQSLYVKMGYVPDGAGIAYDDVPVRALELRPVDDLLTLKMVKKLG